MQDVQVKIAIPCHFWTFIEHKGDPKGFIEVCHDKVSQAEVVLAQECEYYVYTSQWKEGKKLFMKGRL